MSSPSFNPSFLVLTLLGCRFFSYGGKFFDLSSSLNVCLPFFLRFFFSFFLFALSIACYFSLAILLRSTALCYLVSSLSFSKFFSFSVSLLNSSSKSSSSLLKLLCSDQVELERALPVCLISSSNFGYAIYFNIYSSSSLILLIPSY